MKQFYIKGPHKGREGEDLLTFQCAIPGCAFDGLLLGPVTYALHLACDHGAALMWRPAVQVRAAMVAVAMAPNTKTGAAKKAARDALTEIIHEQLANATQAKPDDRVYHVGGPIGEDCPAPAFPALLLASFAFSSMQ